MKITHGHYKDLLPVVQSAVTSPKRYDNLFLRGFIFHLDSKNGDKLTYILACSFLINQNRASMDS